ncbi:MAG: hypothetical protein V4792_05270 [Pseudomonadota bacterium]
MRQWVVGFVAWMLCASACVAADLTPTETRWLQGAWPVIAFAREAKLPLDIVVQPQPSPGAAPLALAFIDGRCKLVLSMRGNAEAEATLERIERDLLGATLEMMAAHELGHCQRYLEGAWYRFPAGFAIRAPAALAAPSQEAYLNMQATRREEAYADLVGLAWVRQRHAQKYERLHAWLLKERAEDLIPGSHHDTLAWLRLVGHADALTHASIFSAAAARWTDGLAAD